MTIRQAKMSDLSEISRICLQLGYSVTEEELVVRLERLLPDTDNAVFVFHNDDVVGSLSGWAHVYGKHLIELEYAEIGGLVVDHESRRKGIGRQLMRKCEEWAREKGYKEIRLRSGGQRKEAHAFYEKIGYKNINWQQLFSKQM